MRTALKPRWDFSPASASDASFKIVANLPYAVATPWLDSILSGRLPQRMVLMLQKEAVDRYSAAAQTKNFGAYPSSSIGLYDSVNTRGIRFLLLSQTESGFMPDSPRSQRNTHSLLKGD